ncbi:AvaI/BsoBI family type II restriction endonuclease [Microcoleus sp.]|uniref:AvaI/BsoBI family type II restriction endonuclease n=1 Tax=Microcoleus sp. TaxID=44472 RepID=UPI003524B56A
MCAYRNHLKCSDDIVTTYEATRAGFVALALEKNRRATPYVAEARALQEAARQAEIPTDLLNVKGIEMGLLTAAGLSDKSLAHLMPKDKIEAINGLIFVVGYVIYRSSHNFDSVDLALVGCVARNNSRQEYKD